MLDLGVRRNQFCIRAPLKEKSVPKRCIMAGDYLTHNIK